MKKLILALMLGLLALPAFADDVINPNGESKDKEHKCVSKSETLAFLQQEGFRQLLEMNNINNIKETIWISSQVAIVTAEKEDVMCVLAFMDKLTFNPQTIDTIHDIYHKNVDKGK